MKYILYFFLLSLTVCSCKQKHKKPTEWYNETKAEILKESQLKADSVSNDTDRGLISKRYYHKGHEFMRKYGKMPPGAEIRYSLDGTFEFRKEICGNGTQGFEGIVYKGQFYGLSTWWHCNGKLEEQGIRYRDNRIGIWHWYDTIGKEIKTEDEGRMDLIDSLPQIAGRIK
jgi:antitoxin component YwqK of YwqJK toxin-antitoxin module